MADGPAGQGNSGTAVDEAGKNQDERQRERHESSNRCGWNHPSPQHRTAGGAKIKPVKTGLNQNERERDGQQMPKNHPPLKTAEDVFWQSGEELFHAAKPKSTNGLSQFRMAFIF